MCGGVYVQYFKINLFILWCPLFFENYLNPQVRINKIVDKHTVDYHPSPSQLILRIHSLIFLWTPKRFISPESFLNFFLNLFIPPWLRKSFKFIVLRSLQIHLWVKKIECFNFYSCPQAKLAPKQTGIAHSYRTAFLKIFFLRRKGGEDYGVEKITKFHKGIGHKFW